MGKKKKADKSSADDDRKLAKKAKKAAKQAAEQVAPNPRGDKVATTPAAPEPAPVAPGNFAVDVPLVALKVIDGALVVASQGKGIPRVALGSSEQLGAAAARALAVAGLAPQQFRLLPLATDLEGPSALAVAWVALGRPAPDLAAWVPVAEFTGRGQALVAAAVERLATLLETTTIGAALCQPEFTVGELREVYAAVWGSDPDGRNFHRKVTGVADFLVETGERTARSGGRPAMLHRAGSATQLNPAVSRVS